jgi:hypothetical protein
MTNKLNAGEVIKWAVTVNYNGPVSFYLKHLNQLRTGDVVHMTQEKVINIGKGATVTAPVFIAETVENCFNTLTASDVDKELEALLKQLLLEVAELSKKVAQENFQSAETMARSAESLVKEATSSKPRRKWYEISVEGIREAAKSIGDIAKPVLDVVSRLAPLLL